MAEWMVRCAFCGEDVDVFDRFTYQRVEGWGRKGKAGGSDIVARVAQPVWAHPRCVDRHKAGVAAQEQLRV